MYVYIPIWFRIRTKPSVIYGPCHLFDTVVRVRRLGERVQENVYPVLQRNAFYAHAETLLVAMVHDEEKITCTLGYRRLLKARNIGSTGRSGVRVFTLPKLKFKAKSYIDMIDWQNAQLTDPPLLKHITNEEIKNLIQSGDMLQSNIPHIPCHSQNVERMIKLVTESCSKVCGSSNRDGWIRSAMLSRSTMPAFDTKRQFATTM